MADEKDTKKVSKVLSEHEIEQLRESTAQMLAKQPKRQVRLPKEKDPKKPNYETVQINGYTFQIMKGTEVMVPEEVYNILVRAGII